MEIATVRTFLFGLATGCRVPEAPERVVQGLEDNMPCVGEPVGAIWAEPFAVGMCLRDRSIVAE